MSNLLRSICIPVLGLGMALPAQEGEKPKPQEPVKVTAPPPSKPVDATANDPAIKALDEFIASKNIDKSKASWRTSLSQPPKLPFDENSNYLWHLDTECGPMTIRYFPKESPLHVSSGLYLARLGFYDGLTFHRVLKGFMAQGGDPAGNGQGGPGYRINIETSNGLKHTKAGTLSMARTNDPNSAGSQFFITFKATTQLDGGYTVWGEVVSGMETVKELENRGTPDDSVKLPAPIKINKSWVSVAPKAGAKPKTEAKPKGEEKPKEGEKKEGEPK